MSMDVKPGYDEDLIKLLYDDVQELKKVKTNRSGDIFKGDLLVDGNLIVKGKVPGEDKVGQLYFGIDTDTPENVLPFNGTPNTGPENRPVSGSKIAFIYAED